MNEQPQETKLVGLDIPPAMVLEIPATEPQEWTVEYVRNFLSYAANRGMCDEYVQAICDAHEAALDDFKRYHHNPIVADLNKKLTAKEDELQAFLTDADSARARNVKLHKQLAATEEARAHFQKLAQTHYDALAAERKITQQLHDDYVGAVDEGQKARDELAAERERSAMWEKQARQYCDELDAEREKVKPLVKALEEIAQYAEGHFAVIASDAVK